MFIRVLYWVFIRLCTPPTVACYWFLHQFTQLSFWFLKFYLKSKCLWLLTGYVWKWSSWFRFYALRMLFLHFYHCFVEVFPFWFEMFDMLYPKSGSSRAVIEQTKQFMCRWNLMTFWNIAYFLGICFLWNGHFNFYLKLFLFLHEGVYCWDETFINFILVLINTSWAKVFLVLNYFLNKYLSLYMIVE